MKKSRLLFLFVAVPIGMMLGGCATVSNDSIDDEAVYRAQDRTFRPMGG